MPVLYERCAQPHLQPRRATKNVGRKFNPIDYLFPSLRQFEPYSEPFKMCFMCPYLVCLGLLFCLLAMAKFPFRKVGLKVLSAEVMWLLPSLLVGDLRG